jgi:outer membrane immunogenic protein
MSKVLFIRAFAAAAIAAGTAAPALSADLYGQQPPAPSQGYTGYTAQAPVANWAGAYLGISPGYSFGGLTNKIAGTGTVKSSINGASIGVYGGVNAIVMTNLVVGAEADLNLSDQHNAQTLGPDFYKATSSWNGSIRGRFGTALDRFMPFVTGGIAFGGNTLNVNGSSSSTGQVGYALGFGVEAFVTDRIVAKGEFIYEGFGDQTHDVGGKAVNTNISSGMLRIGAAYKF